MPTPTIGVSLPTMTRLDPEGFPGVAAAARRVEELGFDAVSAADFITGTGSPALDCAVTLAVAGAVTERVLLRFGVMALPLRPVAWVAAQVGTLQELSGNRVVLGVGTGGMPGAPFWTAVGAEPQGRGRRTDAALAVLPDLLAGKPVQVGDEPESPALTLSPGVAVPPILVGGNSDRAIARAARYGNGWMPSLIPPSRVRAGVTRLRELAQEHGRPVPSVTMWLQSGLGDEPSVAEANESFQQSMVDMYGLTPQMAEQVPITGSPAHAVDRLAAYVEAGVDHFDIAITGGDWLRQCELLAAARDALR